MVRIVTTPIEPAEHYALLASKSAGSVVLHYAVVKENQDPERPTVAIDYQPNGDVEAELAAIAGELGSRTGIEDVLLIRRLGRLGVGEIISLVAASAPNSEEAFAACRAGIARLKKMQTIAKSEHLS